jgi:hypothetical protein
VSWDAAGLGIGPVNSMKVSRSQTRLGLKITMASTPN